MYPRRVPHVPEQETLSEGMLDYIVLVSVNGSRSIPAMYT